MRRLSTKWLGMNTETFLLYSKYLSSLPLLHNSDSSLTQIGLEAGYYDQSHFIREFKSYTNLTPKEYQASVRGLPGYIFL
ncbi:MAG: helix-turn-helix transcriptional regulator [Bacteroidia bacterium]|nr:helix-turn-helix transcriptional regulator [Bacteroidia bacterium]